MNLIDPYMEILGACIRLALVDYIYFDNKYFINKSKSIYSNDRNLVSYRTAKKFLFDNDEGLNRIIKEYDLKINIEFIRKQALLGTKAPLYDALFSNNGNRKVNLKNYATYNTDPHTYSVLEDVQLQLSH